MICLYQFFLHAVDDIQSVHAVGMTTMPRRFAFRPATRHPFPKYRDRR